MDEFGGVGLGEDFWNCFEEGVALDVAGAAEAGVDCVEVAVVVAGMAAEFEDAFGGKGVEGFGEGLGVELAGGGDAEGSVGGEDVGVMDLRDAPEAGLHAIDETEDETTENASVAEAAGPLRFEWVADGSDGGAFGEV